ncbi:MAG TPA: hypothetical protein EYP03_05180, partial [Aquificae bacterium]|nr:hypothetical protein [Aquificota bacterium]
YAAGYSLRKMLNWFMFVLGSQLLILMYLEKLDVITINWDRLGELLVASISALQGTVSLFKGMALMQLSTMLLACSRKCCMVPNC